MISKSGIHALKALMLLAELPKGVYAGAVSIAERIGAPRNYLGKLLQQLARDGLVISQKGLGGGFRLGKSAENIALIDIVEPIEQIYRWQGCVLGRSACSEAKPCAIHERWKKVRNSYLNLLNDTTVADLIQSGKAHDG